MRRPVTHQREQDWQIFIELVLGRSVPEALYSEGPDTISITWPDAVLLEFYSKISSFSDQSNLTAVHEPEAAEEDPGAAAASADEVSVELTEETRTFRDSTDFLTQLLQDVFTYAKFNFTSTVNDEGKLIIDVPAKLFRIQSAQLALIQSVLESSSLQNLRDFLKGDLLSLEVFPETNDETVTPLAPYAVQICQDFPETNQLQIDVQLLVDLVQSCKHPITAVQRDETSGMVTSTFNKAELMARFRETLGREFCLAPSTTPGMSFPIVFPQAAPVDPAEEINIAVLFDISSSMNEKGEFRDITLRFQEFIDYVLQQIPNNVYVTFYLFDTAIKKSPRFNKTTDRAALDDWFKTLQESIPNGKTAMYDALEMALTDHTQHPYQRALLFTDGGDNSSKAGASTRVTTLLQRCQQQADPLQLVTVGCADYKPETLDGLMTAIGSDEKHVKLPDRRDWSELQKNADRLTAQQLVVEILQIADEAAAEAQRLTASALPNRPTPLPRHLVHNDTGLIYNGLRYAVDAGAQLLRYTGRRVSIFRRPAVVEPTAPESAPDPALATPLTQNNPGLHTRARYVLGAATRLLQHAGLFRNPAAAEPTPAPTPKEGQQHTAS